MLAAIGLYLEINGGVVVNVAHVQIYLKVVLESAPGVDTLRIILKEHFKLTFKKPNKANVRYNDPAFDGKRLYVSRLLSQFLFDDVLILSVDESNFRSDAQNGRRWILNDRKLMLMCKK